MGVYYFESACISFMINGLPVGYFLCSRGVRHDDPLSPLLFGIANNFFSCYLYNLVSSNVFKPMLASRLVTAPTHFLYADDIFFYLVSVVLVILRLSWILLFTMVICWTK